jgi:hypothetical protein
VEIDESGYLGAAEWLLPAESPDIVAIAHRVQHDAEARTREPDPFGPTRPGFSRRLRLNCH